MRHGELAADARLPQEQPRARAFGHAHVLDVHALAPQDGQGSGAQLVIGHLAQVRAAVPEPGQGDGQRELRPQTSSLASLSWRTRPLETTPSGSPSV
ncbi:hypothetical protein GCM10020220_057080 [Nonomuraea rubra]